MVVSEADFFSALPRLVWHEDEPIAHPSSVPLYFVSALARNHVKVVLTGEGSDELLAGYGKYPRALVNWRAGAGYEALVPAGARRAVRRLVTRLPGGAGRLAARSFLALDHSPEAVFFDSFAGIRLHALRSLLRPAQVMRATTRAAYGASRFWFDRPGASASLLDRMLYADLKTYLVELLMKQDQMSMAASIESRVPFLDHELVEFAARLPDSWKLRGFTTKRILRSAAADLLPREILERPKMGFPVPFADWMRATADTVLGGKQIRAGDKVALVYTSANRDEDVFADPQSFDIRRSPNPHVSFGIGTHFCLGAHLARLEARVFVEELLAAFGTIEPAGEPARVRSNLANGYKRLPVRLAP